MNQLTTSIKLTPEGLEKLKNDLKDFEEVRRPRAVDRLAQARSMGDLSENNDYIQAKEDLGMIDGQINELKEILTRAELIGDQSSGSGSTISIGSRVMVKVDGKEQTFHIVGEWEADPINQKISHESPLGQALLGKSVGDDVEFDAPVGKLHYKILSIQ